MLAGTYGKKEAPTFTEFVNERWLSTYPKSVGNRPSSIREKEIHVRIHLLPALRRLRLDKINGEVVARLFARLRTKLPEKKKSLAEKTIKNIRATLRRILASAKEWGDIAAIPDLPRVKVPESSWDFFTWEESERLIAACRDDEERALLIFAVHTGARAGSSWRSRGETSIGTTTWWCSGDRRPAGSSDRLRAGVSAKCRSRASSRRRCGGSNTSAAIACSAIRTAHA